MRTQAVKLVRAEALETGSADLGSWPKVRLIFEAAGGEKYEVIELACKLIPVGKGGKILQKPGTAWRGWDNISLIKPD